MNFQTIYNTVSVIVLVFLFGSVYELVKADRLHKDLISSCEEQIRQIECYLDPCENCGGIGYTNYKRELIPCLDCRGLGYLHSPYELMRRNLKKVGSE